MGIWGLGVKGVLILDDRSGYFGDETRVGLAARVALEESGGCFTAQDEANSRDALFGKHIVFIFIDMIYI